MGNNQARGSVSVDDVSKFPPRNTGKATRVRSLYKFNNEQDDELPFEKGDIMIAFVNPDRSWWYAKNMRTGRYGNIPCNYVIKDDGSPSSVDGWFNISRTESNTKLTGPGLFVGAYIVRPSNIPNTFALSVRDFDTNTNLLVVRHYQIYPRTKSKGYYISHSKKFPNMQSLIDFYKEDAYDIACCLTCPVPRDFPTYITRGLELDRSSLVLWRKIGHGCFGDVWQAKLNNSLEVAVKMLKQDDFNDIQRQCFIDEAKLMSQLDHPRIVKLLGLCSKPRNQPVYIVTELMVNGSLLDVLRKDNGRTIKLPNMYIMMYQISDGMAYLESKDLIHRDLRAANILVNDDMSVKVADFGLARIIDEVYTAKPGFMMPIKWTAPEAGMQRTFSTKSDVWSFGVLMFEIVTYGCEPYMELGDKSPLNETFNGHRIPNPNGAKINCPDELYNIMCGCWHEDPNKRHTFNHLKMLFDDYCDMDVCNEEIDGKGYYDGIYDDE